MSQLNKAGFQRYFLIELSSVHLMHKVLVNLELKQDLKQYKLYVRVQRVDISSPFSLFQGAAIQSWDVFHRNIIKLWTGIDPAFYSFYPTKHYCYCPNWLIGSQKKSFGWRYKVSKESSKVTVSNQGI